ncbi:MAG: glycosyltransferase family 4 protein [Verrucomicrobia bacterium]|nr:glycosyltransferase family 4 protein [Verrucomicrobiota bacterium]
MPSADFTGNAERKTSNAERRTLSGYPKKEAYLAPTSRRILLIGNFIPQRQHSMLQFEDSLTSGLQARGVAARCLRPSPFFSRLWIRSRLIWKWLAYLDKFILFPIRLALRRRRVPSEIIHICDHSNAIYLHFLPRHRCLVTCHDLLAIRSARGEFGVHLTAWTGRVLQQWVLSGLRRTSMLVCDSQATRSDLLRIIGPSPPSRIINMCVADIYFSASHRRNAERQMPNAERQTSFLLHVGGTQWYKNRPTARQIYCRLRQRMGNAAPGLLIIGEADNTPPQLGEQLLSDLPVAELAEYYRRADLLLFPSYAEGFGLPIIEAQASGCLVVTTGQPPMNEIGGEGAFYVADPENVEGFVEAVQQVLTLDPTEARRRQNLGYQNAERFRTDAMVAGYLEIYQEMSDH